MTRKKISKEQIEIFKEFTKNFITSSTFKMAQQAILDYHAKIEEMNKFLKPTIEQIEFMRNNYLEDKKNTKDFLLSHKPTEVQILDELIKINKDSTIKNKKSDEIVIVYNTIDSTLNREIDNKIFSYDLSEDGKRRKLLDYLYNEKKYVKTDDLKKYLSSPTSSAVAKIVKGLNEYTKNTLRLKNIKFIDSKKGSGYRINPKITIIRENY